MAFRRRGDRLVAPAGHTLADDGDTWTPVTEFRLKRIARRTPPDHRPLAGVQVGGAEGVDDGLHSELAEPFEVADAGGLRVSGSPSRPLCT